MLLILELIYKNTSSLYTDSAFSFVQCVIHYQISNYEEIKRKTVLPCVRITYLLPEIFTFFKFCSSTPCNF